MISYPQMHEIKIFIVDDAENIRKSLKKMLSDVSFVKIIGEADNIASAIDFLSDNKPDITLLDLNLPDGNGLEILKTIKDGENPHKVIVLTNQSIEQYKVKSFNSGADYFFDKSTEFEKVIEIINSLN